MKHLKKIVILALGVALCGGMAKGSSIRDLREYFYEKADRGISFRFSDADFDFDNFLITKCEKNLEVFARSFAKYCKDLYEGNVKNYSKETDACFCVMKKIEAKAFALEKEKEVQAEYASFWNDWFRRFIYPVRITLDRFICVEKSISDFQPIPKHVLDKFFVDNSIITDEEKEVYLQNSYFSDYESVKKSIEEKSFAPFDKSPRIFINIYMTRAFRGEICCPEKELEVVKKLIEDFEKSSDPIMYETVSCSCCDDGGDQQEATLHTKNILVVDELKKIEDILEECVLIRSVVQAQK